MDHFAGLDVSVKETSVCIVDGTGKMLVGLYRPVHVKTLRSQKLRMLLTHRKLLQSKAIAIENDIWRTRCGPSLKMSVTLRHRSCENLARGANEPPYGGIKIQLFRV